MLANHQDFNRVTSEYPRVTIDSSDSENNGLVEGAGISERNRNLIDSMMSSGIDVDHTHIYRLYKKILITCFSEQD